MYWTVEKQYSGNEQIKLVGHVARVLYICRVKGTEFTSKTQSV